jgi:signal transduction histidine kinase
MVSKLDELLQNQDINEVATALEALRRQEVDAVIGNDQVLLLRLQEAEQNLRETEKQLRQLNESLEQRIADRTAELEQQTERLRQLTAELISAEQEERKRLARTLHDGLQQLLIAAEINLSLVTQVDDPEALEQTQELLAKAKQAARSLAYELAPPALYESNFSEALVWLARWFGENHRFQIAIDVSEELLIASENTKVFLFNAIRELLLNSVKHSGVHEARVRCIKDEDGRLRIEVHDNGNGFDPAYLDNLAEIEKGFGLLSIRERLIALGGSLKITSAPGAGAHFVINFPLVVEEET